MVEVILKRHDMAQEKRAQGRPARGDNEVGSQKIVEGMQVALRTLQTTNVTRKEIAWYAGVTPALVTYYFPERNALIEAATLPVVEALVGKVSACLEQTSSAQLALPNAVAILLEYYARDAAIIDLFSEYKASATNTEIPDLLKDLDCTVMSFFKRWLGENKTCVYDAEFLQKAMLGMCRAVARPKTDAAVRGASQDQRQIEHADMVCYMLIGAMTHAERSDALPSLPEGLQVFDFGGPSH